jgi:hypothetical protein
VPGRGKGGVGGFVEELHGAGAEPPLGLKGYRAERRPGTCVVRVVVPVLVSTPKSCSVARGASRGTKVRSSERMNARYIGEHMAWARAQVAMEVPARLGAIRVAGSEPRTPPLAARKKAQAADEAVPRCRRGVFARLH